MLRFLASLNLPYPPTAIVRWGVLRAAARTAQRAANAVIVAMREWWPLTASDDGLATHAGLLALSRQAGETDEEWRLRVAREPAARRLWGRNGAVTAALDAVAQGEYDLWEFPRDDGLHLDVDELDGYKRLEEGPALVVWPTSAGSLSADEAAEMREYLERTLDADVEVGVFTDLPLAAAIAAPAAAAITDVAVTSTPMLDSETVYGEGERIEISVTFTEAVIAAAGTDFVLSVAGRRRAPLLSGSGTRTLVFGYTVQAADSDDNGIWIGDQDRTLVGDRGGDPQNGAITSVATGQPADLTHSGLGTQAGHKVDGSRSAFQPPGGTPRLLVGPNANLRIDAGGILNVG